MTPYYEGGWRDRACQVNTEKWQQGVGYITVISRLPRASRLWKKAMSSTNERSRAAPFSLGLLFAAFTQRWIVFFCFFPECLLRVCRTLVLIRPACM